MSDLFSYLNEKDDYDDVADRLPAPKSKKPKKEVLSVTQLSNQLRMAVEGKFSSVAVEGEISGYMKAASGHIYFDLKDKDNLIKSIVWRGQAEKLSCALEDGLQVVVYGKLTTYGARSTYQIIVNKVEAAGVGALMRKFEETKARLEAEGLFDADIKQEIPYIPEKIGIITSPTGAVIDDMLHRIRDRFPSSIALYPVLVQGVGAKEQIAEGLEYFNNLPNDEQPDVLIVARGGGSLEDLWAFNEEIVVRAIAASYIPVVTAVGHEPDVTLADYVADLRAPTPTAAAEMVVPVKADLVYTMATLKGKLEQAMFHNVSSTRKNLKLLSQALGDPVSQLNQAKLRLDERSERFIQSFSSFTKLKRQHMDNLKSRFTADVMNRQISLLKNTLQEKEKLLMSLSPDGPLKRGYVYLTGNNGMIVRKVADAEGKEVLMHFADGEVTAKVNKKGKLK